MLDSSGSVGDNLSKMVSFCKTILANADIDSGNVKVGILSFNDKANIEFHMTNYSTKLGVFQAIDNISRKSSGGTDIATAFMIVRTEMFTSPHDRDNVSNVLMIITDGEKSNVNERNTAEEANKTRNEQIRIFAIVSNLNKKQEPELLKIVTQPPTDNIMDFTQCVNLSSQVFQTTCKEGNILHNISNAEIDKKVLELRKTLEIRKNETARYRRMKVSATDDRLSSAVMGYVGVMVIVSIISLFVFFDCVSVWQYHYDT
ncbi:Hypothetical predicted protein [Mytilus galloprovincialis]|uniref:VWFA domain-containing protein n=1 Tax=Mytilus galloprovincialis TaxID=29158 RepID=A0A8B6E8K3_MYTGA|nr:Hypothetical predicted protein [Mytilus galloprovincialis]